jgi:protein SCO1/2
MTSYHQTARKHSRGHSLALAVCLCLFAGILGAGTGFSQVASVGDKTAGDNTGNELPNVLQKVAVAQHLNQELPLNATFVDDTGKTVRLGDYFGKRPALFSLVYFNCPMLCSEELDGMTSALEMVHLTPGKDFDVIVVSIDPTDTPQVAAQKKAFYLKRYGRPETANGWHFLTGQKPAIDAVTSAVGFGYVRVPGPDGRLTQFAHASSLEVVTTDGKLAQYYLGVEYSPKDVLIGLIQASGNKIGSPVANILTYCYHYDPQTNKQSLRIARVVQFGGMVTMASLGGFMFVMFRKDIKLGRDHDLMAARTGGGTSSGRSAARTAKDGSNGHYLDYDKRNGDKG